MFSKGPMPGGGSKEDVLALHPKAVCRREWFGYAHLTRPIVAYCVYLEPSDTEHFAASLSSNGAWGEALSKLRAGRTKEDR